ncbi:MAG: hypothetical protein HYT39_01185 [Candidatus Sungbacteria bacterium]|nr:hypothetical protein [Candidatus Sungbacteria bacterium]
MTRTAKIVIFLGAGILALLLVWAGLNYFSPPSKDGTSGIKLPQIFPGGGLLTPPKSLTGGGEPTQTSAKISQIVKEPVIGATLDRNRSQLLYFKRAGGNLFRSDLDGTNEERLSNLTILGIYEVKWSPDLELAIVRYLDENGATKTFIFNAASSTTSFLPAGITSIDWSPDGKLLAYTQTFADGVRVITSDVFGKNVKTALESPIADLRVAWQSRSNLILAPPASYAVKNVSFLVPIGKPAKDLISGTGLSILAGGSATSVKDVLTITSTSGEGVMGFLRFASVSRLATSTTVATLAEKCAWGITMMLYCAEPSGDLSPWRLPDDWYQGKMLFSDNIVRINALDMTASTITLNGSFDATHIFITPDERFVFFINKADGNLWRAEINK